MIVLTEEQRQVIISGKPVRVPAPEIGRDVVLLTADTFEKIQALLEDEEDRLLQAGWQQLAQKGVALSLEEEP